MKPSTCRAPSHGFTIVELLVTIAIVVALALLVLVVTNRMKLAAYKAESVNNLRALSAVTMANAADNNGFFKGIHPAGQRAPYWFSRTFRDDAQLPRSQCYSSANERWKPSGRDVYLGRELWDWPDGASSVWGYVCLVNDNGWADGSAFEVPDNWKRIQNEVTVGRAVRWVPERTGVEVAYPILWMDLTREWGGHVVGNFMKNDKEPRGTHIGYLDGRIEWIDGANMKGRCRVSDSRLFW